MKLLNILIITASLGSIAPALAQDISLIPGKTWAPISPPSSPSEIHERWSNGIDAVAWWIDLFAKRETDKNIKKYLDESISKIVNDLQWTGEGALINVRLIESTSPNSPFKAVGILGDRAWYAGTGRSPEEALFQFWRTPQLRPGVPSGWSEDPLGDNYFWVTIDSYGIVSRTVVPRGLAVDLDQQVKFNFDKLATQAYERSWNNLNVWQNIADAARQRLTDRKAKDAVSTAIAAVKESQARVASANLKLQAALDSERRAGQALAFVHTMQGILTVAQLVQEVRSTMDEPVPELSNASSAEAVINTTKTIADSRVEQRTKMVAVFNGSLDDLQTFLDRLHSLAKEAGAPPIVDEKLTVNHRPMP